jgi:acetoin utilization protein AcuB
MLVGMWMNRDLGTIAPEDSVFTAATTMTERHVRRLLVTRPGTPGPHLVGIVTSHDIMRAAPPHVNPFSPAVAAEDGLARPVSEIMTRKPRTVAPDTPIEEAARLMRTHKIGALPVLQNGQVIGIITESDLFDAFIEVAGIEVPAVRVTFELGDEEDPLPDLLAIAERHHMRLVSFFSLQHSDKRTQAERRLGVARLVGPAADATVDAIWKSGHRVVSVLGLSF